MTLDQKKIALAIFQRNTANRTQEESRAGMYFACEAAIKFDGIMNLSPEARKECIRKFNIENGHSFPESYSWE